MASYIVTHTDGTTYTIVGEGVVDNSLGISLVGQNYHNYGQLIANNFLRLLENHASSTPPLNPQEGQLWWNSSTNVLSFFDGDKFKPCSSSAVGITPPLNPLNGDQWWDTNSNQLKIFDSESWSVIGPLYTKGQLFTGVLPESVTDASGNLHNIATLQVTGETVAVLSKDAAFLLPNGHDINGITTVSPGLSLTANTIFSGTSTNSERLGGVLADKFVQTSAITTTLDGSLIVRGMNGVLVGGTDFVTLSRRTTNDFAVEASTGKLSLISDNVSLTIDGIAGTATVAVEPTVDKSIATKYYVDRISNIGSNAANAYTDQKISALVGGATLSTLSQLSTAIGNDPSFSINTSAALATKASIFSPVLTGTPRAPTPPANDSSTKIATTEFVQQLFSPIGGSAINTINGSLVPITDNTIDIGTAANRFRNLYATGVTAKYADLAEKYVADGVYRPGTVMVFGGKNEVTVSDQYCDSRIAGIVSTDPAYLMNSGAQGLPIALSGKVPCKVVGPVKKGDVLVNSHFAGVAIALSNSVYWVPGCVIGKSMEDNSGEGIRDIMVAVGRF